MQHILKAKEQNNAPLIVVDPRFTRTAAHADEYVRMRSGSDMAVIWGILWHVFENRWEDVGFIRQRVWGMAQITVPGRLLAMVRATRLSCEPGTPLTAALMEMTAKSLGCTTVTDHNGHLIGIYTDGDLRRTLDRQIDIHQLSIDSEMTSPCRSITADALAVDALNLMEQHKISALPVVDAGNRVIGALNMLDLLRAGVV